MGEPRIVRQSTGGAEIFHENYTGPACLLLYWPESCPYTPEQVMAACERKGVVIASVPINEMSTDRWWVRVRSQPGNSEWTETLTPDFIGEPAPCNCMPIGSAGPWFTCPRCKGRRKDQRTEQRRKGEKRGLWSPLFVNPDPSGRRGPDRRCCKDRRQAP